MAAGAVQIFKKTASNKLLFRKVPIVKQLRFGERGTYLALRQLDSASQKFSSSKLENLTTEAEKVVGYQTSLLRCLLSEEISSVLVHSKKLVGSRHPLVKTARKLVYDGANAFDAVGLVVLLMSRNGEELMCEAAPIGQEPVSGIQQKQRKLAEVAEMINTGYMVHLGMVNKSDFQPTDDIKTMNFGNKITVLTGDFLLSKASVGLSELENTQVVDVMASVIGDIVEGETIKDYKILNDTSIEVWEEFVYKSRGSLFAKSCLASLKICSLTQHHQDAGYKFGKNLGFLQQLSKDYHELFDNNLKTVSLNNAAVILNKHLLPANVLQNPLNTFIPLSEDNKLKLQSFDREQNIEDLAKGYGNKALKCLECFPSSEARHCLENLVQHFMTLQIK